MVRLIPSDSEALLELYPIYCEAFPENERKSFEKLSELVSSEAYQLIVAYDTQIDLQKPVGFVCILKGTYIWLDYLLVDPTFQGAGYGGQIVKALIEMYKSIHEGMFLEVEKISIADINTQRRVEFYERLGAFATTIDYQLPTEKGGLVMDLFYFPFRVSMPNTSDCLLAIKTAFDTIHNDLTTRHNVYDWILEHNKNRICAQQNNANRF